MPDEIQKALKRLDSIPCQMVWRGSKIVKIPAQKIELPIKDGIQEIFIVPVDIFDE